MYNKVVKAAPLKIIASELPNVLKEAKLSRYWQVETALDEDKSTKLIRECSFKDFETTWSFLHQVAMRAHLWGHHPSITTTYNRVRLELNTHDIDNGTIADIDIKLAKRIEKYIQLHDGED